MQYAPTVLNPETGRPSRYLGSSLVLMTSRWQGALGCHSVDIGRRRGTAAHGPREAPQAPERRSGGDRGTH